MDLPPTEHVLAALLRALSVAALSGLAAGPVLAAWQRCGRRRLLTILLVLPVAAPWLVSVYGLIRWQPHLVRSPWLLEAMLVLAWTARALPVVVLIRALAPADPWTARARFLAQHMAPRGGVYPPPYRLGRLVWSGPGLAAALVFLWVFSGFAAESLLKRPGWSPWAFERIALQVPSAQVLAGVGMILLPLGVLVALLARTRRPRRAPWADRGPASPGRFPGLGLPIAALAAFLVPGVSLLGIVQQGMPALGGAWSRAGLVGELASTVLVSGAGALLAWWSVRLVVPVALGLAGPVAVAALVHWGAVSLPEGLRDTPLPLAVALGLLGAPAALLLRAAIFRDRPHHATATAARIPSGNAFRLRHRLRGWKVTAALLLLAAWNAFEVAATAVLAPLGKPPISVFLFNQMHYGATAPLAATVLMAMAAISVVAAGVWWLDGRVSDLARERVR